MTRDGVAETRPYISLYVCLIGVDMPYTRLLAEWMHTGWARAEGMRPIG